jgi:hypothetical protein
MPHRKINDITPQEWSAMAAKSREEKMNSLSLQEGGDHYKKHKIQPIEYAMANGLDACQANVVKYVTRYKDKGGIQDLKKARHYIDMLIDFYQESGEE